MVFARDYNPIQEDHHSASETQLEGYSAENGTSVTTSTPLCMSSNRELKM